MVLQRCSPEWIKKKTPLPKCYSIQQKQKFVELFNIQVKRISENVKRIVLMDAAIEMKRHAQSALTRIRNPLIRQLKSLNY